MDKKLYEPYRWKDIKTWDRCEGWYRKVQHHVYVGENVVIDDSAILNPSVYISDNVKIGKNVILRDGATVGPNTIISDNCIIPRHTYVRSRRFEDQNG